MHHTKGEKVFILTMYASLVALLGVAGYFIWVNVQKLLLATVKPIRTSIDGITGDNIWTMTFTLGIKNPSDIDLFITGYNLELKINGYHTAQMVSLANQYVAANSDSTLDVTANFKPKEIFKSAGTLSFITTLLTDYKSFKVQIVGTIGVKHKIFPVSLPVNYSATIGELLG